MRNFARVENGNVVEVFDLDEHHPDASGIDGMFHPSLDWRPAPAGCAAGWVELGGQLVAPNHYQVLRAETPIYRNHAEQLGALIKAVQALSAGQPIPPDAVAVLNAIVAVKVAIPKV